MLFLIVGVVVLIIGSKTKIGGCDCRGGGSPTCDIVVAVDVATIR